MNNLLGILRIALGWVFLWAFLDKLIGLGYSTVPEKAWIAGGSPTIGFLKSAEGSFAPFFNSLAGQMWVDVLFMVGLLGIGIALTLGIGMRIATYTGSLLLFLMYLAEFPIATNPILDDHIVYIIVLFVLYSGSSGKYLGFGKSWEKSGLVKQYPVLK